MPVAEPVRKSIRLVDAVRDQREGDSKKSRPL